MSKLLKVSADPIAVVAEAAEELRAGRAVVIPTDTVYGLAVLPDNLELLYQLKHRPQDKAVALLVAAAGDAETFFEPLGPTRRLMERFWPGALTIVQDGHGVRCPDDPFVQALARAVGPIATSSANLSGAPTAATAAEAGAVFPAVAVVVDGGICRSAPSTVVEVTESGVTVLREGAIPAEAVRVAVAGP